MLEIVQQFLDIDNYILLIALGIVNKDEWEVALQTVVSMVLCPTKMTDFVRRHRSVSRKEKYKEVNIQERLKQTFISFFKCLLMATHSAGHMKKKKWFPPKDWV